MDRHRSHDAIGDAATMPTNPGASPHCGYMTTF
jgi:hypothetical protein